jgi:hypothetical protein
VETANSELREFYDRLLSCLRLPAAHEGQWKLLECTPAWDANGSWDCFICFVWQGLRSASLVVVVNYAPGQSQCYLHLPFDNLRGKTLRFRDLMGQAVYHRDGDEILSRGLFLDLPAWGHHVFELTFPF